MVCNGEIDLFGTDFVELILAEILLYDQML
jgi:hypothetical protein